MQSVYQRLTARSEPIAAWPEPDSELEDLIFACAALLFTEPTRSHRARVVLRTAIGDRKFEFLAGLLAFLRTAHYWTIVHPEIEIEEDMSALLRQHEDLARLLLNDPEAARSDMGRRLFDELTSLRELHERKELEKAKRALEAKDRQTDEFIAVLAHELRNPLAAIRAATDALTVMGTNDSRAETFEGWQSIAIGRHVSSFQPERSGCPTNNFSNAYRVDSDARTLSVTGAHVCSSRPPTASLTLHLGGDYARRMSMPERLVDIKAGERLLHTFPVTTCDRTAEAGDEAFKKKALEAAANAKVVPNEKLETLSARMHVSRGGPLQPNPDPLGVLAETKEGLDQVVRERAFLLWEAAGRPDGMADEFWRQAQHQRWSERAHALWEREGSPEGKADEHWFRILDFERCA